MSGVDLIVPCYKYAHYLRQCVMSALQQPGVDVRVLILDDASPDHTPKVAAELLADPRVSYRRHVTNQGHIATYNEGLAWASADATLLLSADDLLTPGALKRAAHLLAGHPEVGMVYGGQIAITTETPDPPFLQESAPDCKSRILTSAAFLEMVCATASNPVPTPTVVVRTSLLKKVGGYRPELPHTGDLEMWLRLAAHADVGILEVDQAYKRFHGQNMQIAYQATIRDIEEHRKAFETLFREQGALLADREKLERMVASALGQRAFWGASHAFDRGEMGNCQELMDYALRTCPELRSQRDWMRFRWKQRLGQKVWAALRPWVNRLRGLPV